MAERHISGTLKTPQRKVLQIRLKICSRTVFRVSIEQLHPSLMSPSAMSSIGCRVVKHLVNLLVPMRKALIASAH